MEKKLRYSLQCNERLKSRKKISRMFSEGKHFTRYPFKVVWACVPDGEILQVGFSVSSRNFKKAVDRNYIKRRMREAYRLQKHPLQDALAKQKKSMQVFLLYIGNEKPTFSFCAEHIEAILNRLIKHSHAVD